MTGFEAAGNKTDEDLAREARAGSSRSFEELALRYRRRLFAYFRPRMGSDQDAEDLVQETLLKLYRNIGRYDATYHFSTWAYTAAGRLAISRYRKKTTGEAGLKSLAAEEGCVRTEEARDGASSSRLWSLAGTLQPSQFRALWLRYAEEMTVDEIAVSMGKSRLAVRLLLHRARTNLMKREGEKRCSVR
ncbi:MAG: sigma-70 family RNA polymerase sigma factor [Candidatus Aminicenantes bacterium]|nr:sigma-70 family RNA polymerase sigma factor [Candidatus Aminicenantes bacterium]